MAAMSIAGESENIPSWVANWPHCCDFGGDTCDGLRGAPMVLDASKSQQNAPFHCILWPGLICVCLYVCVCVSVHVFVCLYVFYVVGFLLFLFSK